MLRIDGQELIDRGRVDGTRTKEKVPKVLHGNGLPSAIKWEEENLMS